MTREALADGGGLTRVSHRVRHVSGSGGPRRPAHRLRTLDPVGRSS